MKFGNLLNSKAYKEWKFYYLDYDHLKEMVKDIVLKTGKQDLDLPLQYEEERLFVEALDCELQKVKLLVRAPSWLGNFQTFSPWTFPLL